MYSGCPVCDAKFICPHNSIVYTHPEIAKDFHPTKNGKVKLTELSAGSGKKIWWVCEINSSHVWQATVANRTKQHQNCNKCVNKTEAKLYDLLLKLYPSIVYGKKIESCKRIKYLPFDFCIEEIKTIIELDGGQHFKQVSNWKKPDITMREDIFKMQMAEAEGYKIIRISQEDVYNSICNRTDWVDLNLLPEIESQDRRHTFIARNDSLYDKHIELYNIGIKITL